MAKDPVHVIADRSQGALRRKFLDAVRLLQAKRISIDALAEAIANGAISVQLQTAMANWPEDLKAAVAVINQVFAQAGQQAERELEDRYRVQVQFDLVNPRAVAAAEAHTAKLVREVTAQTQAALQTIIATAIQDGHPPRVAAKQIRPLIGLTERQAMAVVHYRKNLVDAGGAPADVDRAAAKYADKLLRQRALTIARTETIRAGNLGREQTWQEAVEKGFLSPEATKRWVVTEDDRLCPVCEPLDGVEVGLRELFSTSVGSVSGPPLHPSCRCTTTLVNPRRTRAAA